MKVMEKLNVFNYFVMEYQIYFINYFMKCYLIQNYLYYLHSMIVKWICELLMN
jgi:hypothetical protein